jgi:proteasome accessory factor B
VVGWRGRWYVVGHDLDRGALRCFRLSRLVGPVTVTGPPGAFTPPTDVDLISHVVQGSEPVERHGRATLLVRPDRAEGVRRWAERVDPGPDGDIAVVPYHHADGLAAWLVSYGTDVRVLDPPEVRDAVITRLKEITANAEAVAA